MPMIGQTPSNSQESKGIERNVYVFEALKMNETAEITDGVFFKIDQKHIQVIKSNTEGNFELSLPEGKYSLLVEEKNGLFANSFSGAESWIQLVEVKAGEITEITITVNYMAAY